MEHKPKLERFLPPPEGVGASALDDEPTTEVRSRPPASSGIGFSNRRRIRAGLAGAVVLLIVGAATVAATNVLRIGGSAAPSRIDRNEVAGGTGEQTPDPVKARKDQAPRIRAPNSRSGDRRVKPRRVRLKVPIAVAKSHEAEPVAEPQGRTIGRRRSPPQGEKKRPQKTRAKRTRAKKKVPPPAPPGVPLFHCFSAKRKDHYMTADQASVGQMEESRADYDCTVVGYVYDTEVQGTKAIPLDDGTSVYIFSAADVRTEPTCTKHELYVHRGGRDSWYNTTESDEGVAGYICT